MDSGVSRRSQFQASREPLRQEPTLQLKEDRVTGAVPFLNPTQARYTGVRTAGEGQQRETTRPDDAAPTSINLPAVATVDTLPSNVEYSYTSRDNRKGRHALVVTSTDLKDNAAIAPPSTASTRAVAKGIWRMCTYFPYWDISWLVAVSFTIGSVVWVINSFFVFLPIHKPSTEFKGEVLYGGGITAFIGATIFEVGSVFLMLEAVNENRVGCFGWAVEKLWHEHNDETSPSTRVVPVKDSCTHHHQNTSNLVGKPSSTATSGPGPSTSSDINPSSSPRSWTWWPSTPDLQTHYMHDLGFLACLTQFLAATVFYISGITALPGIYNNLAHPLVDALYWTPQVVGGLGFVLAGSLFMLETQRHWWRPAFGLLGWWVGFFNWIGGWGFLLCPCFGFDRDEWAQYQAAVATFWGSWAFLVGSLMQWYESLEKHPVEVVKGGDGKWGG